MRFLLKCIFWLGGVFLLMPGIISKQTNINPPLPQMLNNPTAVESNNPPAPLSSSPDLIEQWLQAGKTLQEITTFCERNPALCRAGTATAKQAGEQALIRVKDAYGTLTGPAAEKSSAPPGTPAALNIPVPAQRPR